MWIHVASVGLLFGSWLPFLAPVSHHIERNHTVCTSPASGDVACQAKVYAQSDGTVKPKATAPTLPAGLSPAQLRGAYNVPASNGGRVAIVIAYDNPNVKSDLDRYSQTFGLPVMPTCGRSVQTGCFAKYDQRGGQNYPQRNRGWAFESTLDVQTVHAVCPTCRIDLIEASSASINNLMVAVDRAVTLGAPVVSMSWGAGEFSSQTSFDSHFTAAGTTFVASSGDSGYGTSWPAASGNVIAAGGTTLTLDSAGARATETAWSGSGSGCSLYESKPVWQTDLGCANRTIADVSAVADPSTGAAIYSTYNPYGSGWFQVGGTSLSAPIIASLVDVAGAGSQAAVIAKLYTPLSTPSLYDVSAGFNGSCSISYLCAAGLGYDGPTGLGAPIGLGAL